jgi:hypothetical protein
MGQSRCVVPQPMQRTPYDAVTLVGGSGVKLSPPCAKSIEWTTGNRPHFRIY